jgi:hypothetical protein
MGWPAWLDGFRPTRSRKVEGSDRPRTLTIPAVDLPGCLIIPLIIQTIRRDPSRSVWIDEAPNVSRADPSGADQIDAEHQATDLVLGLPPRHGSCACIEGFRPVHLVGVELVAGMVGNGEWPCYGAGSLWKGAS